MRRALLIILLFSHYPFNAQARGPLPDITSSSSFLVYYGNDFSQSNIDYMKGFEMLVLHPSSSSNLTPGIVQELQDAADVKYVLGYISVGEDFPGTGEAAITHDGAGPIYQDAVSQEIVFGNAGIASFYVDAEFNSDTGQYEHDGTADTNGTFFGYFINPNSDWRWVLDVSRIGGNEGVFTERKLRAGLQQIGGQRDQSSLQDRTANFGFDGYFLDTIDTAGPYSGEGSYPWTAPAMQETIKWISDAYPEKVVFANRGSFFFQAGLTNTSYNIKPTDYSIRPYIDAFLFESYMLDSAESHSGISPYHSDNHNNLMPKIVTEANREDGFTVFNLDYKMNRGEDLYDDVFDIAVKENGWATYLTSARAINTIDTTIADKLSDATLLQDNVAPQWMNTGALFEQTLPARVGVASVEPGFKQGDINVFWDSAKDQSWPVKYNVYLAQQADFSDEAKYENASFTPNTFWYDDPTMNVANQFTITGLPAGQYYVRVRAEDSSIAANEDTNTEAIAIIVPGN